MVGSKPTISTIAQSVLLPQESMLEVKKQKHQLFIGIPKETSFQENRIALVPEAVALLVNNGHHIVVEANAGIASHFTDSDYSEAGAQIVYSPEDVYKADIILKVGNPANAEIEMMQAKQTLISILRIANQNEEYIKKLSNKRISAIAFDYIRDKTGIFPIVQIMSEIAGSASVLIAAEYLGNSNGGKGLLLGGISGVTSTEVVILGAGTVGEFAARAAIGLGAEVKVFDNSLYKLRRLQNNIGTRISTSILDPKTLLKALKTADVAIGAILAKEGLAPCVVSEDMVSEMKFGSVIVDVSIDQGGCFETSQPTNHTHPTFRKYGVTHYCVPNIASRVSRTASYALSNIVSPILLRIGNGGGIENVLWADEGFRNGVYLYKGAVTNKYISEVCKMPFKDLNLLMATRF